ncbi:unnamed protein product [Caenorhabditis sp. 36 PRJEB53466]|nr:unnamed protein product [Caenorhabditis sp. 36 PRJEB53466]
MTCTTSSEEEEADVPRAALIFDVFVFYFDRFVKTLPSFTGQIVVLFCVLPVSVSIAVFLVTALFNFGIAFVAQTISSVVLLLLLVPCLTLCVLSAISTAYLLQIGHFVYRRLVRPPPTHFRKLEIEEKLKIS